MELKRMIKKIFVFELEGIVRNTTPKVYKQEPTKEQVLEDMKEWFFENHQSWFAIKEDDKETNLDDWLSE
jgi:hypothetical protein